MINEVTWNVLGARSSYPCVRISISLTERSIVSAGVCFLFLVTNNGEGEWNLLDRAFADDGVDDHGR